MNTATESKTAVMASDPQPIQLSELRDAQYSTLSLDPNTMGQMMAVAEAMAKATVTIPTHFRGKPADCLAVVMQAFRWKFDPFVVASKTHVTQSGVLGYEAQLINAVINASGAVTNQPEFEFIGDWKKILGKVAEKQSEKGGKYYVATWDKKDEDGLGVIVSATLRGEKEPRSITIMMSQAYPRFSTQWATDPQQQITYLAVRKFSRRYAPGAILGVYTPEELQEVGMREIQAEVVTERQTGTARLKDAVKRQAGPKLQDVLDLIAKMVTKEERDAAKAFAAPLTGDDSIKASEAFKARLEWIKANPPAKEAPVEKTQTGTTIDQGTGEIFDQADAASGKTKVNETPIVSYAQVEHALVSATALDTLDLAADLIQYVHIEGASEDLGKIYRKKRDELTG